MKYIPNHIKNLITDKFLHEFINKWNEFYEEEICFEKFKDNGNTYAWYHAFEYACLNNGSNGKGILKYYDRLPACDFYSFTDADCFAYGLILMCLERGIIKKGEDYPPHEEYKDDEFGYWSESTVKIADGVYWLEKTWNWYDQN